MPISRQSVRQPDPEAGFILLMVLFLMVLLLIALAVAAPRVARSIQRDKETELVHRGEQYKRAIKLYYKRFGSYPSSIDQLVNTNNIRFLRKRYTDPITGKDDWRLIYLGQAKVPPMGLFGQPLMGLPGQAGVATTISGAAGTSPSSASAFGSSAFGSSNTDTGAFGSSNSGATSTSTDGSGSASTDGSGSASNSSGTDTGFGSSAGTGATPFGSSTNGSSNPTLGGGPIVGVGIPSGKASLIEYKKQKHYNQWEFVYNPIEDQLQAAAGVLGGSTQNLNGASPAAGTGPGSGSSTGTDPFASNNGGSGPNSGSGSTGSGGTSTSPTGSSPQQQ